MEWNWKQIAEGKLEILQICGHPITQSWTTNGSKKKSKGQFENILRKPKVKIQHTKTYRMHQKQNWGKFIVINTYIKEKKFQTSPLKAQEKEEKTKAEANRKKEIIKIRAELNEKENRKPIN